MRRRKTGKQLLIYNSYSQHSYINADAIRRAIANETMKSERSDRTAGRRGSLCGRWRSRRSRSLQRRGRPLGDPIAQRLGGEQMEAEAKRIGEETGLARWIRPIATAHTYNAAAGLYRVMAQLPFSG
ncbi:hypothetical protein GCM10020258_51450 [Sphingomonas yabuuchiae]